MMTQNDITQYNIVDLGLDLSKEPYLTRTINIYSPKYIFVIPKPTPEEIQPMYPNTSFDYDVDDCYINCNFYVRIKGTVGINIFYSGPATLSDFDNDHWFFSFKGCPLSYENLFLPNQSTEGYYFSYNLYFLKDAESINNPLGYFTKEVGNTDDFPYSATATIDDRLYPLADLQVMGQDYYWATIASQQELSFSNKVSEWASDVYELQNKIQGTYTQQVQSIMSSVSSGDLSVISSAADDLEETIETVQNKLFKVNEEVS